MHREPERRVDANGLRDDRGRQAELRVARGIEEVELAAGFADHHVGARDVRAARLVDREERNLAGAERAARVDLAARLRVNLAREQRRDARQEHGRGARDQAAREELAPRRGSAVAAHAAILVDALLEAALPLGGRAL